MIKRIIKFLIMGLLFICLLSFGGYTFKSFKSEIHLRDPEAVLNPLVENLPNLPSSNDIIDSLPSYEHEQGNGLVANNSNSDTTTDSTDSSGIDLGTSEDSTFEPDFNTDPGLDDHELPTTTDDSSNSYVDENGNLKHQNISEAAKKGTSEITFTYARSIKVNIDGKEIELVSKNTISFVKWLDNMYKPDSDVTYEVEKDQEITSEENKSTENNDSTENGELVYDTTLLNEANLNALVNSIRVIDSLPKYDDYNRTDYEKPVKSYKLDGKKVNRNDYAWKTSPWYNTADNTYMCPYTGNIIHDLDDKKEDNDFGNLDYDHIVPLKSTYLRGAKDWTDEQKNAYAYDQWVGVDVLNSANRSKSDKGPCDYLPDINVEDYCYSWLMICSKYDLAMTQEEIDLCVDTINIALENGEEVTFLGGSYEIN